MEIPVDNVEYPYGIRLHKSCPRREGTCETGYFPLNWCRWFITSS